MRNTFIETLAQVAEGHPNVWLLCGDLGYAVLEPFAARFPDRYVNIGVAEQNMAGIAAGLAISGKTVFIYSIGNFPTLRCLEQLRNDVCYHGADVKVVAVGAGFAYGSQGYTHHALEDLGILSTLPGMEVFVPCDPAEVRAATQLIAESGRPSYLRLSRAGEPLLHGRQPVDLYRPLVLREGQRVVILTSGPLAAECLKAAELIAATYLSVAVISVPCLKPFDDAFLREIAGRAELIVTVEEHILRGGLYSMVSSVLAAERRHPPVLGLGIPEQSGKLSVAGDREALLSAVGLSAAGIAARIGRALGTAEPMEDA